MRTGSLRVGLALGLVVVCLVGIWLLVSRTPAIRYRDSNSGKKPVVAVGASPVVGVKDAYGGFELVGGVYKPAWGLREPKYTPGIYARDAVDAMYRRKVNRKLSPRARELSWGDYGIVLDESGGRYDVAYVFADVRQSEVTSVGPGPVWRVPLKREGDEMVNEHFPFTLKLGKGAQSVVKNAEFSLKVKMENGKPGSVEFFRRGGWYGTIPTTSGIYSYEVIDSDMDGIYNEGQGTRYLCPSCNRYHYTGVDNVHIQGLDSVSGLGGQVSEGTCPASGAALVAGKLYEFETSVTGDRLVVKPYAGPVGTLKIVAVDGFGKPGGFNLNFDREWRHLVVSGVGSLTVKLPVGSYKAFGTVGVPRQLGPKRASHAQCWSVSGEVSGALKIAAGSNSVVKMGGPMRIIFSPSERPIVVKAGSKKSVMVSMDMAGLYKAHPWGDPDRKMAVRVLDSAGKNVGARDSASYDIRPVETGSLKPGDYTITASYDFSPYAPAVSERAKIRVVK